MVDTPLAGLPPRLIEIAEAIGPAAADCLAQAFGGTRIWIAVKPRPDNPVVEAIGTDGMARLMAAFGNGWLLVPMGPHADRARKRQRIRALLAEGYSHQAIARAVNCHVRTVERHAGDISRCDDQQHELPLISCSATTQ